MSKEKKYGIETMRDEELVAWLDKQVELRNAVIEHSCGAVISGEDRDFGLFSSSCFYRLANILGKSVESVESKDPVCRYTMYSFVYKDYTIKYFD